MYPWPPIGENVARLRRLIDLTQEELAQKAGVSVDLVRRLEQSSRMTARVTSLYNIANALDVPLSVLLSQPNVLHPHERDREAGVLAVRQALTPAQNGSPPTEQSPEVLSATELQSSGREGWRLYRSGEFSTLAAFLPELITAGERAAQQLDSEGQATAFTALADIYQATAALLTHLGHGDLSYIAAQKAIVAADRGNDPNLRAVTFSTLSFVLLRQGRLTEAENVALSVAEDTEPRFTKATSVQLSVWGNLLWMGSTAASRNAKPAQAMDLLRLIEAVAHRVAEDRWDYSMPFGPTSVAMHAVGLAVERGDSAQALELEQRVPRSGKVPLTTRARVPAGCGTGAVP